MKYYTRKLIRPTDLNANNTLFGGSLLRWIDEEACIYVMSKLESQNVVTKYMSEIDFVSTARQGDVIEIGIQLVRVGRTSITLRCEVRHIQTKEVIIKIEQLVFVKVDDQERPVAHGKTMDDFTLNT